MNFINSIDPFLMQLVIVPVVVIGLGVVAAILTKRVFVGPIVTLLLYLLYEIWSSLYYYPESEMSLTLFIIIYPFITFIISGVADKHGEKD
ncbi:hypothetical protein [Virgibacillus halodenitrificans]|uniref:hypothetical protein n=1 Tax=Virgibacillus halodenitrificans TaxID=1482 RepID=UPI00045CA96A|nr:hypothetical protein [Virgibacillus halodenitrificans]CDQ32674.1 hypothetical protein BN993_02095 [Virgibacillus halodenitrificans]